MTPEESMMATCTMISLSTSVLLAIVAKSVVSLRVSMLRRMYRSALSISPIERSTFSSNTIAKF